MLAILMKVLEKIGSQCTTFVVKGNPSFMRGDSVACGIATILVSSLPYRGFTPQCLDTSV